MKLQTLVQNANQTYDLGLDGSAVESMCGKLRRAGVGAEVSASAASAAIDMMLSFTDTNDNPAHEVYATLKTIAAPLADGACPRCREGMRQVLLVGNRKADYCEPCNIALPVKIEA